MSLYSTNIQLLPRPPRSLFSLGSDLTRATLPDFATVAELSQFTNRIFNWHLPISSLYIQAIVGTCLIYLIITIVGLIFARKIYEGKFWLVRIIRKPTGVIVVPNPMLSYHLMAGLCGIIHTPYFITACRKYDYHSGPPSHILLWLSMPWLSLVYGIILAVLGTYFATPDALSSAPLQERHASSFNRFFQRADVINTIAILLPTALTLIITIPTVIASRHWEEALSMQRDWQTEYSQLPNFTQEMVEQSQMIWFKALKGARLASIVYALWTAIAFPLSLAYFYVSFRLMNVIRQDIARAKKQEGSNGGQVTKEHVPVHVSQIIRDVLAATAKKTMLSTSSNQVISTTPTINEVLSEKESARSPLPSQSKILEQALFQIFFQTSCIGPAAACFGGVSLILSLTLFSKLEQPSIDGGNQFESYFGGIWLFLMYMSIVAGALNFFTLGYKTYEPILLQRRQQRQSTTLINFKDVTSHIKPAFFASVSLPFPSPTMVNLPLEDDTEEGRCMPEEIVSQSINSYRLQLPDMPALSFDTQATGQIDYSIDSSSPSSVSKSLASSPPFTANALG